MRVAGMPFDIPDEFYDRTEADEWADTVPAVVLLNLHTWQHVRTYTRQALQPLGSVEGFIDAAIEAFGRRRSLDMRWTVPAGAPTDTRTDDNPNLGMF